MKNLFRGSGKQNTNPQEENVAIDLEEQDLEEVNGASGDDHHYDDSCEYDEHDYCHRHHHHRHHHHHHDY